MPLIVSGLWSQERTILKVGVYDNPPKILVDDHGSAAGFHVELFDAIAAEYGWNVRYVTGSFAQGLDRLQYGAIDIMLDVAVSSEREDRYLFNEETVLTDWAVLYGRLRFKPVDWSSLDRTRVACMEGDIHIDGPMGFRALIEQFLIDVEFLPVEDYDEAFRLIESGDADIAVVNRLFGALNESEYRVEKTPIFFDPISIRYAFAPTRKSEEYAREIDRVLAEMKSDSDSVYYQLISKYFVSPDQETEIPAWVFFAFGGLAFVIIALVLFYIRHKREIVRRKASEEALAKARDQAEEASRAKGVFLANMTHEIRTPMNAVLGYTEILLRENGLAEKHRKYLGVIHKSGEHLLAMINDILDMSRISAGNVTEEAASFRLDSLIEDVAEFFIPMARRKDLHLQTRIHESLRMPIVGDVHKIRQILINLVGNAVKFTARGGVVLDAAMEKESRQDFLRITVTDTGPGIPEEDAERIFEAFDQGSLASRREGGTGLGLAISRHLAGFLGGTLVLAANSGDGCSFVLRLPARMGERTEADVGKGRRAISVDPKHLPKAVLIADDKETNRDIIADILGPLGFDLSFAADGKECVEKFRESSPDLVVLDIRMPVMDGIVATETIRKMPRGHAVGIIAVSASTLESERETILTKGADRFLFKPFRIGEFLDSVGSLLGIEFVYEERIGGAGSPFLPDAPSLDDGIRNRLLDACRVGSRRDLAAIVEEGGLPGPAASFILDRLELYDFDGIAEALNRK